MNNASKEYKHTVSAEDIAIIAEKTDWNDHSGAVLSLARVLQFTSMGHWSETATTKKELATLVEKAEKVVNRHELEGCLSEENKKSRDFVKMMCFAHLNSRYSNAKEVRMAF